MKRRTIGILTALVGLSLLGGFMFSTASAKYRLLEGATLFEYNYECVSHPCRVTRKYYGANRSRDERSRLAIQDFPKDKGWTLDRRLGCDIYERGNVHVEAVRGLDFFDNLTPDPYVFITTDASIWDHVLHHLWEDQYRSDTWKRMSSSAYNRGPFPWDKP